MASTRPTIELINPAAFRSYGTVKRIAATEQARPQNPSGDDGVPKSRVVRPTERPHMHALDASKSLLQTGSLLAAQTAGTVTTTLPHAGLANPQGVQAYRLVNGEVPAPINILVDWQL